MVQGVVVQIKTETDDGPKGPSPLEPSLLRRQTLRFVEPFPELEHTLSLHRELDVDRRRRVRLVLDFGLGERGAAVRAPVHRLLALVDHVLLDEFAERADDGRLIREVQRLVGVIPRPDHAEPLEVAALDVHVLLRVGAAGAAEIRRAHLLLLRPELAVDLQLDWQAVAIPAGDVRRVEAQHVVRLDDEVLEDLVERVPHVDLAVGVRRAVVEQVFLRALAGGANLAVEVHLLPAGDGVRLSRLQVRLHREGRPRQVAGVFPIRHGYPAIVPGA